MAQFLSKPFGMTPNGEKINEYIISNPGGLAVSVLNYGCIIKNIWVPTKRGPVDVVLGHDTYADYVKDFESSGSTCCGAFVGRYANRIENAVFNVGGKTYQLEANNGKNHLHGTFPGKGLWRYPASGGRKPRWRGWFPGKSEDLGAVYPHRGQRPADGLPCLL
jgi:aldose 1-epimerase